MHEQSHPRRNTSSSRPLLQNIPFTIHSSTSGACLPFFPSHPSQYTCSTTVTVRNFDPASVQKTIPAGTAAYVANVTINGQRLASRCHFDFYDTFRVGGEIVIELTADKEAVNDCCKCFSLFFAQGCYPGLIGGMHSGPSGVDLNGWVRVC